MDGQDLVIELGVHGTRHAGTAQHPASRPRAQSSLEARRPLSAGGRLRLPATVERGVHIKAVPTREAGQWLGTDSPLEPESSDRAPPAEPLRLQGLFDGEAPAEAKTEVRVPQLVLTGLPAPKEPLSAREALARQAEADRIAVKTALDRFGFADHAAKWQPAPNVLFFRRGDPKSSSTLSPKEALAMDKEPPLEQVAAELGARLDPVHAASNPDRFQNVKVHTMQAMAVPAELQNLSEMAHALAHGEELKQKVAQASNVAGIIGVRRPGYNPLLRKYEQRLPKAVALYLDRGRGAISDYPTEMVKNRRGLQVREVASGDPKEKDEDETAPKPKLRASIERLAQPTPRRSGRNEPSGMSWHLPNHLRLQHKERDFKSENAKELGRFNRQFREAEVKRRVAQHMSQVKLTHATMLVRANSSREHYLQKQKIREERAEQIKREKEMLLERQAHQRAWLKWISVLCAGQIFLHAATQGTDYDARHKNNPLQTVRTGMHTVLMSARATRLNMALRGSKEAQRMNTLSLIRWFFENRPLIRGERVPAIYRLVLRMRYRKQMRYITQASAVVKDVLIAVGHVKNTLYQMKQWKMEVIKCQRMIRRALIRRDQHLFVILSHVNEYTSLHILKEIMFGVTSLFPPTSAFNSRREMALTNHKDVKVHLMRAQEVSNYARIFPGLPLWVAISLEKLSAELIKVYSAEYSVNLQASRVWDTFARVFKNATLQQQAARALTWKIYNDLSTQCRVSWDDYFRRRELFDARIEQQKFIVDSLCESFGPDAEKLWAEEQRRQNSVLGELKRPTFPMHLVQPNKVQDFYKEIFAQARQEQQAYQAAKEALTLKRKGGAADAPTDALGQTACETEQTRQTIEEAREALLSRQRAKILERVSTKNLLALAPKAGAPSEGETLVGAAGEAEAEAAGVDPQAARLDKRVAQLQEYLNVRVNTANAFRHLLPQLPSKTLVSHKACAVGSELASLVEGRKGGRGASPTNMQRHDTHRKGNTGKSSESGKSVANI